VATTTSIRLRDKLTRLERGSWTDEAARDGLAALLAAHLGTLRVRTVRDLDRTLRAEAPEERLVTGCVLAAYLGDRRSTVPRLVSVLGATESDLVRLEAAKALLQLGGSNVLRAVEPLARDHEEVRVRELAAYALAHGLDFDERAATVALLAIFTDLDEAPLVRAQAAEGLAYHVPPRRRRTIVPHVVAALSDPSPDVRFWSCFALAELGGRDEIRALEELCGDRTIPESWGWSVGREARFALECIRHRLGEGPEADWPEDGELA
jgi:HEAT repeat protein